MNPSMPQAPRSKWEPVSTSEWEPVPAAGGWEPVSEPFHPGQSIKAGIVSGWSSMLSSFDRGMESWLQFSKDPLVKGVLSVVDPAGAAVWEAARQSGMPEELAKRAEERQEKAEAPPEASIKSILDDPSFRSVGNWVAYQLGALPSQVGPGMLSALAGGIVGGKLGAGIGAVASSYLQNSGDLYESLLSRGIDKEEAALYAQAGALPIAMLDSAVPGWLGGKLAKKLVAKKVVERALEETAAKKALVEAAKTTAKSAATEGVTEGLQEVIGTATESLATGDEFLTPANMLRWADATAAGAFMGGVVGGTVEALPQAEHHGKTLADFEREAEEPQPPAQAELPASEPEPTPAPEPEPTPASEPEPSLSPEPAPTPQEAVGDEAEDLLERTTTRLPMFERTEDGRIKLGAEMSSLAKMLSTSLYGAQSGRVIAKELIQNAIDAAREVPDGVVHVDVAPAREVFKSVPLQSKVDIGYADNAIVVQDNGPGMTEEELATVFTDLGSSGKRHSQTATGGFGVAKAAPLLLGRLMHVETVARDKDGKLYLSVMESTPGDITGGGVRVTKTEVTDRPTGTTVRVLLDSKASFYDTEHYLKGAVHSINLPVKLIYPRRPDYYENKPSYKKEDMFETSGAVVDVYASEEKTTSSSLATPVHIHNNGVFQYTRNVYLPSEADAGLPRELAVDVRAKVEEGTPGYPFTLNREELIKEVASAVDSYARKLVAKRLNAMADETNRQFKQLPMVPGTTVRVWDSGKRLTPDETASLLTNPVMRRVADTLRMLVDRVRKAHEEKRAHYRELGVNIADIGIVLSDEVFGVMIPVPGETKQYVLFINPFAIAYDHNTDRVVTPAEAGSALWHTTKHEILHEIKAGHGEPFTTGEFYVTRTLGTRVEVASLLEAEALYEELIEGELRRDFATALHLYQESRRRQQTEADVFRGEASRTGEPPPVGPGDVEPSGFVSRSGEEAIREGDSPTERAQSNEDVEAAARALADAMADDARRRQFEDSIRADLDRFGSFSRRFLHVLQWHWRNPHNVQLGRYIGVLRKMVSLGDKWRSVANQTIMVGRKLSRQQTEALSKMIFELTLWSDRQRRAPTPDELDKKRIEVARKHGVDERGMAVYLRIRADLAEALNTEERYERERIQRIYAGKPQLEAELKRALRESEEKFAKARAKEFFPLARFGNLAVVVKAREPVQVGGRTYNKGDIVLFELFEHERSLPGIPKSWRPNLQDGLREARKAFPPDSFDVYDWQLPEGTDTLLAYPSALYRAIETGLQLTDEQRKDLAQMIVSSSPAQAFIRHWQRRRGIKGFSRDMWRAYASYFSGFANHISRLAYRDELEQTIIEHRRTISAAGRRYGSARRRQQIQDAIEAHFKDVMHPRNYAPTLRAYAFLMYFFAVPRQAIINLTQLPVFAYPYFVGMLREAGVLPAVADATVVSTMAKACYDAARLYQGKAAGILGSVAGAASGIAFGPAGVGLGAQLGAAIATQATKQGTFEIESPSLSPREIRLLKQAQADGLYDQGYATMLASLAGGNSIISMAPLEPFDRLFKSLLETGTLMFRASEQYNRIVTLLTASRLAESRGMSEKAAYAFAQDAINRTMFIHEAWARPELLRGRLSVVTIFKTFLQNALFAFWQNPGRMRSWLMMGLLGGLMGLPGGEDLLRLVDWTGTYIRKTFFDDGDPLVDIKHTLREIFTAIDANPDLLMHGLARNSFGFPYLGREIGLDIPSMDFSASLSLGRIVPFIESAQGLTLGTIDAPTAMYRAMQDALGVVGTMGNGALRYAFDSSDRAYAFWRLVAPSVARYASLAFEAQTAGKITDKRGRDIVRYDLENLEHRSEILAMTLGALPTRVAQMQENEWVRMEAARFYFSWRGAVIDDLADAIIKKEPGAQAKAMQALARYNANVPKGLQISGSSVRRAAMERTRDRVLDALGLPESASMVQLWRDFEAAYGGTKP